MIEVVDTTIIINGEKSTLEDKIDLETGIDNIVKGGHKIIHLDLSNTTYIPSELMGLLMWKKKELSEQGISIRITKISTLLKTILDNAMLSDFFEITGKTEVI